MSPLSKVWQACAHLQAKRPCGPHIKWCPCEMVSDELVKVKHAHRAMDVCWVSQQHTCLPPAGHCASAAHGQACMRGSSCTLELICRTYCPRPANVAYLGALAPSSGVSPSSPSRFVGAGTTQYRHACTHHINCAFTRDAFSTEGAYGGIS